MSTPKGCTNLKLRQLARLVTRHYESHLADAGMLITQYSLLAHVASLGPSPSRAVADAMRLSPSALTRNLQPLVQRGWVSVTTGTDGRERLLTATPEGQARRAEARASWKRAQLALNAVLGTERVAALHAVLDDCMAVLEAHEHNPEGQGHD
jgi:DNA-binding MarR family transcriptional regulator